MDIVESLRTEAAMPGCRNPLAQKEAADEIERLRAEIRVMATENGWSEDKISEILDGPQR